MTIRLEGKILLRALTKLKPTLTVYIFNNMKITCSVIIYSS